MEKEMFKAETFAKSDEMMKPFYEEYIVKGKLPDREEMNTNLRFFATFALNCNRLGILEVGKAMGDRLNCYAWMLQKSGCKFGKWYVGKKLFGFHEILDRAFNYLRVE